MKAILTAIALVGIFIASFIFGQKLGKDQPSVKSWPHRVARGHMLLGRQNGALLLYYRCNGRTLAWRNLNQGDKIFADDFPDRPEPFALATIKGYSGYVMSALGGGFVAAIKPQQLLRAVRTPTSKGGRRVILALATGVSGAYLGYQYATRDKPRCDHAEVLATLHDRKTWDIAERAIAFRLVHQNLQMEETGKQPDIDLSTIVSAPPGTLSGQEFDGVIEQSLIDITPARMERVLKKNVELTAKTTSLADRVFAAVFFLPTWAFVIACILVPGVLLWILLAAALFYARDFTRRLWSGRAS